MGTLFSTLDIARSGLQVSQAQLDVTAHNIANVNTAGFTRQRAEISSRSPVVFPFGEIGRGVQMDTVQRLRDTYLDTVYRLQTPNLGSANVQNEYYTRIEDIFLEPTESGFGTRINSFFDVLNDFANNVESTPTRESVVAEAQALADSLSDVAQRLYSLRTNANEHIQDLVPEVNSITEQIVKLNDRIRLGEGSGAPSNDLRDERDRLLDDLSSLMNVTIKERSDGQVDVLVGDQELVSGIFRREIAAVRNASLDPDRKDLVEVRFVDDNSLLKIENGEIFGALNIRDTVIPDIDARMDKLAATVIQAVNRIHSQGNGLQNLSGTISASNVVSSPTVALNSAGLPFTSSSGSFDVVVYDSAGNATTTTIAVDPSTMTLNDLATALSGVANFSASVVGGNTLELGAASGYTFSFANDTSGALAALGVNGLFTGHDARTIGVNQDIADNPSLLTSSYSNDVKETGDNEAALALAEVRNALLLDNGSTSVNAYYEGLIARIGIQARAIENTQSVEQAFVEDFETRRQETSGVSLDEEVTYMMQYQRAFQASARVVTVIDEMLNTLINGMA